MSFRTHFAICLLLSTFVLRNSFADSPERKLKVGAILALTGAGAQTGSSIRDGVELAKSDLESKGWKVEISYDDDQTLPARTLAAFHAFRSKGLKLFIGPTWSFQAEALGPLVSRTAAVVIVPAGSSDISGGKHSGMYFLTPNVSRKTHAVREWLTEVKPKKAALIAPQGVWGDVHKSVYSGVLAELQIPVMYRSTYSYGDEGLVFPAAVGEFRRQGIDTLLTTNTPEGEALLIKKLREQQYPIRILTTDNIFDAINSNLVNLNSSQPEIYALVRNPAPDFKEKFQITYNRPALMFGDTGYDAVMVLANAVEKVGTDPEALRAFLNQQPPFPGKSGSISFDSNGDVSVDDYVVKKVSK